VPDENRPNANPGTATLLTMVVVVAVLYFARVVLIPLALAILFAFLLAPIVVGLRHWHLGRVPSAFAVVLLAFGVIAIVIALMSSQLTDLAYQLPGYQQNIRQKLDSIRTSGGGVISRITRFAREVSDDFIPPPSLSGKTQPGEEKPVQVEIRRMPFSPIQLAGTVLGSMVNILLEAAIVIVFVIFLLIQREDLRDRLIRVVGASKLHVTTQALDDATHRVSRYLQAQLFINVVFGIAAGIGLYFLRVPNPWLWAMVAALFRYVPYLGIWVAAIMPAAISFAVDAGWMKPFEIFGLYLGIDLLIYNFVEPLLYGNSTGISPFAILVSAVFWTWLWGPVGLLLATPLTVCLVVIGRYVPSLEFLSVVLSDEPVLPPATRFYQRMLAMDVDEARHVAQEFLKGKSLEELYDRVIIPALTLAEEDRHNGHLDEAREEFIFQNTRLLLRDVYERTDAIVSRGADAKDDEKPADAERQEKTPAAAELTVITIPARDEADELAALMLEQLLAKRGIPVRTVCAGSLASECLEEVGRENFKVACVCAVPPRGYIHTRYLCKRLHAEFPNLKVIAAILNEGDVQRIRKRQPAIPADEFATSLEQAVAEIISLSGTENSAQEEQALAS